MRCLLRETPKRRRRLFQIEEGFPDKTPKVTKNFFFKIMIYNCHYDYRLIHFLFLFPYIELLAASRLNFVTIPELLVIFIVSLFAYLFYMHFNLATSRLRPDFWLANWDAVLIRERCLFETLILMPSISDSFSDSCEKHKTLSCL